jgi:predicted phosphate transport protein (TIGR00153 family)
MLGRLMPREGRFFELFDAHAERIVEGSRELAEMLGRFDELEARAARIDAAEHAADRLTHECVALLHRQFLTPFDRDQMHQLITRMDDILDLVQGVGESVTLYDLRAVTPEAAELARISHTCCERVKAAVALLPDARRSQSAVLRYCDEIDRLESDADRVMRDALSRLFREEQDLKQVMKLRVIYDLLESITDRCEDVANVLEGIVLENA